MKDTGKMGGGPQVSWFLSLHAAFWGNKGSFSIIFGELFTMVPYIPPYSWKGSLHCRPCLTNLFVWCWHETQGIMQTKHVLCH